MTNEKHNVRLNSVRGKKTSGRENWFYITVGILMFMLLLSLGSLGVIGYMFHENLEAYREWPKELLSQNDLFSSGAEATLLASGLSIIGLAVAVWTGINIANAIQRGEFDQLTEAVKEQLAIIRKTSANVEKVDSEASRHLFLQELLKTRKDIISERFFSAFSELNVEGVHWHKLVEIERQFYMVYDMHGSSDLLNASLRTAAVKGVQLIDCWGKEDNALIEQYLVFRKADFLFYRGYAEKKVPSFYCFKGAIASYGELWMRELGVMADSEACPFSKGNKRELAVYLANSIGEAYGKILLDYTTTYNAFREEEELLRQMEKSTLEVMENLKFLDTSKTEAIRYGECAVRWSKDTKYAENEVIFRNLGCHYERLDRADGNQFVNAEKIINNYQKAFQFMAKDNETRPSRMKKVYHVLLSYYKKYLEYIWGIRWEPDEKRGNGEVCFYFEEIVVELSTEERLKRSEEFLRYASFARTDGKHNHFLIVMYGFANFYAWMMACQTRKMVCGHTIEDCCNNVSMAVKDLELLGSSDNYAKQLKAQLRYMESQKSE